MLKETGWVSVGFGLTARCLVYSRLRGRRFKVNPKYQEGGLVGFMFIDTIVHIPIQHCTYPQGPQNCTYTYSSPAISTLVGRENDTIPNPRAHSKMPETRTRTQTVQCQSSLVYIGPQWNQLLSPTTSSPSPPTSFRFSSAAAASTSEHGPRRRAFGVSIGGHEDGPISTASLSDLIWINFGYTSTSLGGCGMFLYVSCHPFWEGIRQRLGRFLSSKP